MIADSDIPFTDQVALLTKSRITTIGRYFADENIENEKYKILFPPEAGQLKAANIRVFTIFSNQLTSQVVKITHR